MFYSRGFSLFELLIVLAILGILISICVPLYSQHIVKTKRLEAAVMLNKLAIAIEEYHIIHNTYQYARLTDLELPERIADNRYQLIIASASDSDYQLQAKPLEDQARKDILCGTLTLNSRGEKSVTGTGTLAECW